MNPEAVQETTGILPAGTSTIPNDSVLPGCELLQQERLRTEVVSRLLDPWLGPKAELLESKAVLLRYVPGKRCNFQIELMRVVILQMGVVVPPELIEGRRDRWQCLGAA